MNTEFDPKVRRATGIILPRDYGMTLWTGTERTFLSPMRYVTGSSIAEGETGELSGVAREGSDFIATVRSRTDKKEEFFLRLGLHTLNGSPAFTLHRCDCKDYKRGSKGKLALVCAHLAGLELALARDNESGEAAARNRTRLTEQPRSPPVPLPFNLDETTVRAYNERYDDETMFPLSRELLSHPELYWQTMKEFLMMGRARFAIHRQRAHTVKREIGSTTDKRYGAIGHMIRKLAARVLETPGFHREGYSLAFPGSSQEAVAHRFRRNNDVYEIVTGIDPVTKEVRAPYLVHKKLGAFAKNWLDSTDVREDALKRRAPYTVVDDASRRTAELTVIVPSTRTGIYVPEILMRDYSRLRG